MITERPRPRRARLATTAWLFLLYLVMTNETTTAETLYEGLPTGPGLIREDRDGTVYAAVIGAADGIVLRYADGDWEIWHKGPIQGLQVAPDGDLWIAQGSEIVRHPSGRDPIIRTPSFMPEEAPGPLLATREGDIWCAGCAQMRRGDALFAAVPLAPSGWSITPCCEDSFGNVWAIADDGQRQDLAVVNRQYPHAWRLIDLPAEYCASPWAGAMVDDSGFVWVGMPGAALRVDPRAASGHRLFASPVDVRVTAIARSASRQVVLGFADGSVRELIAAVDQEPQWRTILPSGAGPVQALLHDRAGDLWVMAAGTIARIPALRAPWHADWDEQPRMPAGNHDHIFARIGDRLYTAGGKTFFGWPADEWVNLDHVWSYDINDGTWRVEPPMLEPGKAYSGIGALTGELWLLGGNFRDEEAKWGTGKTATVEIYDPQSRRLRFGPRLPRPADQIVALTVGERLYAIGGADDEGPAPDVLSIASGETAWRRHMPAPGPIMQASGCVLDSKIYIAAGPAAECPGLFVYDPGQDRWDQITTPAPQAPQAPMCTAFAGKVWVMGGRGKGGGQTATYAYSPDSGEWQRGPDIPLPVSWAAAADVNGRLLIAGGAYEDGKVGNFFNTDRVFLLRSDR